MAEQKSRLVIEIDPSQAKTTIAALSKELHGLTENGELSAKKVRQLGRDAADQSGRLDAMTQAVKRLAAGYLTWQTAQTLVMRADGYTNLQNRLRLVTDSQQGLNAATEETFRIAQRTRSSWEGTVQVYQRFAQNAQRLKLSQEQVARATETMGKAVALSGASAGAAQAAMVQFGQALASGVLRGDEFNSMAENTPAVMDAMARGLGVSRGELRAMAADGKLTAEAVTQALLRVSDSVDADFAKTQATVGQAFQSFNDSLTKFAGEADKATGASRALAEMLLTAGKHIDALAFGAATAGGIAFVRMLATAQVAVAGTSVRLLTMNGLLAATQSLLMGPVGLVLAAGAAAGAYAYLTSSVVDNSDALEINADRLRKTVEEYKRLNTQGQTRYMEELKEKIADVNKELEGRKAGLVYGYDHVKGMEELMRSFTEGKIKLEDLNAAMLNGTDANEATRESILKLAREYEQAKTVGANLKLEQDALNGKVADLQPAAGKAADGVAELARKTEDYTAKVKAAVAEVEKLQGRWADSVADNSAYISFREKGYDDATAKEMAKVKAAFVRKGVADDDATLKAFEAFPEIRKKIELEKQAAAWQEKDRKRLQAANREEKLRTKELEKRKKITATEKLWRGGAGERVLGHAHRHRYAELEQRHGLPKNLLAALEMQESHGNAAAVSPVGARGVFQFMPASAKHWGVNVNDVRSSAEGAARYLKYLLKMFHGNVELAVNAYNHGEGNTLKRLKSGRAAPKETRSHWAGVSANLDWLNGGRGEFKDDPRQTYAELPPDLYAQTLEDLQRQIDMVGLLSEAQKFGYELEKGRLKDLSAEEKAQLAAKRETLDSLSREAEERGRLKELAEEAGRDFSDRLFELDLIGKTADETARLRLERKYDLMVVQAQKDGASQGYVDGLLAQKQAAEEARLAVQKLREEKANDWQGGIAEGIGSYAESLGTLHENVARQVEASFAKMGDALADFVATGKLDFRSLTVSILQDISRMMVKMAILNAVKAASGYSDGGAVGGGTERFDNLFWRGGAVGYASGGQVYGLAGSTGGYTGGGGKYEPAGIVHRGEVVFSQADVRRHGGVQAVERLRLRGFADGGTVGLPSPVSAALNRQAVAQNTNISVTVNVQGGGDNVRQDAEDGAHAGVLKAVREIAVNAARTEVGNSLRPGGQIYQAMRG
ncbi:tape measure protein [Neisseria elongata]|uniref:tape measure protein n=1 Tax=Neisseria elongata TaxID=495 RepID=UPI0024B04914|nr:tape measure protein [Neisseria elongata]